MTAKEIKNNAVRMEQNYDLTHYFQAILCMSFVGSIYISTRHQNPVPLL